MYLHNLQSKYKNKIIIIIDYRTLSWAQFQLNPAILFLMQASFHLERNSFPEIDRRSTLGMLFWSVPGYRDPNLQHTTHKIPHLKVKNKFIFS